MDAITPTYVMHCNVLLRFSSSSDAWPRLCPEWTRQNRSRKIVSFLLLSRSFSCM